MKKILIVSCFMFIASCATAGKKMNFNAFFQDELSDIRENINNGSPSQNIQNLSMLLEMEPKNKEARFLRAVALQKVNRFEEAAEDYKILIKQEPGLAKAHYNLAMIYAFKLNDKKSALRCFDSFLSLDYESNKAFSAAKIMRTLAKPNTAFAEWGVKQAENEKDPRARKKLLLEAVSIDPTSANAHRQLAEILQNEGKKAQADLHLAKASLFNSNSY